MTYEISINRPQPVNPIVDNDIVLLNHNSTITVHMICQSCCLVVGSVKLQGALNFGIFSYVIWILPFSVTTNNDGHAAFCFKTNWLYLYHFSSMIHSCVSNHVNTAIKFLFISVKISGGFLF